MATKKEKRPELFDLSQYGHFYAPNEVIEFLVRLTQPKPAETVLCIGFDPQVVNSIIGEDIQALSVRAEALPLIDTEVAGLQAFDVILCGPTFGIVSPESNEPNEEMWLKWSVEHLSQNGRLAIIVPIGLLSNVSQESIRRFLLEEGGLEAVIELPSGWAHGTAIQASILYITTNLDLARPVRMFRLSENSDVSWAVLEKEVRNHNPKLPITSSGKAFTVPASRLEATRLDAKYYDPQYEVTSPEQSFDAVKLGELVDIWSGIRFKEDDLQLGGIPFVQVRNLNLDGSLNLRDVRTIKPKVAADSRGYSQPGDILVSIAGTIGKVAIVPPQTNVCIDTSLRRLRILDASRVLPEYLALYLQSDRAKLQMERWFSGSVIRVLPTASLEQIIVYLPDIKKQKEAVQTLQKLVRHHTEQLLLVFPNIEQMQSVVSAPSQAAAPSQTPVGSAPQKPPLQEIVKAEFPFSIARTYTLFEAATNESAVSQVRRLIAASEAVVYYSYGILVADQLHRLKINDPDLKLLLNGSITDFSLDKRIKYIFRIIKLAQDDPDIRLFVPEIVNGEFGTCSDIHNNVRNKFSHTDMPDAWCRKVVKDFRPRIKRLLESLLPIREYRLAQVTSVSVRDGRPQHHITTMMGDNSLFPTQVEDLDSLLPADTQHVILLDQNYNVLDFHPFYVFHGWESTGMQNHLCFLKQITGQPPKQKLKIESTEGAGDTEIEMDLKLSKLL
jgi:hypothetical protein